MYYITIYIPIKLRYNHSISSSTSLPHFLPSCPPFSIVSPTPALPPKCMASSSADIPVTNTYKQMNIQVKPTFYVDNVFQPSFVLNLYECAGAKIYRKKKNKQDLLVVCLEERETETQRQRYIRQPVWEKTAPSKAYPQFPSSSSWIQISSDQFSNELNNRLIHYPFAILLSLWQYYQLEIKTSILSKNCHQKQKTPYQKQ